MEAAPGPFGCSTSTNSIAWGSPSSATPCASDTAGTRKYHQTSRPGAQPPDLLVEWWDEGREPPTEFLWSIALVARDSEAVAQEEQAAPDARDVFDRQQPARRQQDADDQEDEQRAARHHGLAPDIGEGRIRR